MPDAHNVPLERQIACVEREIAMRRNVYPRWVAGGRMSPENAEAEISAMIAVLDTLLGLRDAALDDAPPGDEPAASPRGKSRAEAATRGRK